MGAFSLAAAFPVSSVIWKLLPCKSFKELQITHKRLISYISICISQTICENSFQRKALDSILGIIGELKL